MKPHNTKNEKKKRKKHKLPTKTQKLDFSRVTPET